MARRARVVITGIPYHITHRGNRRGEVFFCDLDRRLYLADLAVWAHDHRLAVWGWCLMSNHVHLLAVPQTTEALALAVGRVHQRHGRRINAARGWTGHLWANRFYSTPLDEAHLWTAIRYVELNPVRAGLVARAEDWPWSSARAHAGVAGSEEIPLLDPARPFGGTRPHPLTGQPLAWGEWLALAEEPDRIAALRRATLTGRPCGSEEFVMEMEGRVGRRLGRQKPGPKPREVHDDQNQLELF